MRCSSIVLSDDCNAAAAHVHGRLPPVLYFSPDASISVVPHSGKSLMACLFVLNLYLLMASQLAVRKTFGSSRQHWRPNPTRSSARVYASFSIRHSETSFFFFFLKRVFKSCVSASRSMGAGGAQTPTGCVYTVFWMSDASPLSLNLWGRGRKRRENPAASLLLGSSPASPLLPSLQSSKPGLHLITVFKYTHTHAYIRVRVCSAFALC